MGTSFTPGGSPGSMSRILALTRSMTSRAFSPSRMMTMPETASPFPSRWETPLLRSGPSTTSPTSLTRMGVPPSPAPSAMLSRSATEIDVDLVLPHVAADRRHVGDAEHRLQVIAQVPILVRAQLRGAVLSGRVDEDVLEHPAQARRVRAELRLHALR